MPAPGRRWSLVKPRVRASLLLTQGLTLTPDHAKTMKIKLLVILSPALLFGAALGWAQPSGYALDFNGADNYASLILTAPPSHDYTAAAWVYLRAGGTYGGTRMAVLGGTGCGDSIELLIRSQTGSATDPQYLELGRCDYFNGTPSASPVPLNAWTHVAVTVDASQTVRYYINGQFDLEWAYPSGDFSLGTTVNLGDNAGLRSFDGLLADVQLWNRALSEAEVQTYMQQTPTGSESGLYAYYPFDEGSGSTTADRAAAGGGSFGLLVNDPTWVRLPILVTNTADAGPGSLRQTIADALAGDTVIFAGGLSGQTIVLTNGELLLNNNLTIDGSALAGGITISGNGASRVFEVAGGATVVLQGLTITNGYADGGQAGGGIFSHGRLTVNAVSIVGNYATFGGGIYQDAGALVVSNSLVANNTSYDCGGVYNWGPGSTLWVWNSTLAGNAATNGADPGGYGVRSGGGFKSYLGTTVMENVTIAENSASDFGGGVNNYGGALTLSNSIVANNTAPAPANLAGDFSGGNNLLDVDPQLAPLGRYGGPTQSMPPRPGSPAIDGCTGGTALTTDQRGFPRLVGPLADLGAVEYVASPVITSQEDSGVGSLRDTITYSTNGTTITFAPNLSGATIRLANGELFLDQNFTLDASALADGLRFDGNGANRIFEVGAGLTVKLDSLTLTNGAALGDLGGAILNSGTLTLEACTLAGNQASYEGGAIENNGSLTVNDCTFVGNSGTGGGAIDNNGPLIANNSTFFGNTTTGYDGDAIWAGGTVSITNCTVVGNTGAAGVPAAIGQYGDAPIVIVNSIVAQNANGDIGGSFTGANNFTGGDPQLAPLGNYGGPTQTMPPLASSPVLDAGGPTTLATDQRGLPRVIGAAPDLGAVEANFNPVVTTPADAGAGSLRQTILDAVPGCTITFDPSLSGTTIALTSGELALNQSLTIDGSALPGGLTLSGGNANRIFNVNSGPTVNLIGLTIAQGWTPDAGGGLYSAAGSTLEIARCTFVGNSALEGGGLLNDGVLRLENCTFSGNHGAYGSAFQCRGLATLDHCTMAGNDASGGIASVYNKWTTLTVRDSIIAGNTPVVDGRDLYSQEAALVFMNANLIQSVVLDRPSAATHGPAPLIGEPLLAPLGNYGGPTQTRPPLPGSPVIDAGGPTTLSTDQRGLPRAVGSVPDLGAVELQTPALVVSTSADSGLGSLRQAISVADVSATLSFDTHLSGQTITLTDGQLLLNKNLVIDGSALPGGISLSGNSASRVFTVANGATVLLDSLSLTGLEAADYGGAIDNFGTLTVNRCTLAGNHAGFDGGAIMNNPGSSLTLLNSTLNGNSGHEGGAVRCVAAEFLATNCTFTANTATWVGGACSIANQGPLAVLDHLTVVSNTATSSADGGGGGVFFWDQSALLMDCVIAGNEGIGGADLAVNYNAISFQGNNLIQALANNLSTVTGPTPMNLPPLLAPLGNYGGPTQTMPPLAGSPAIDTGGATTLSTDQRGFPRIVGHFADLGAVEVQVISSTRPPVLTGLTRLGSGTFQFSFTNLSGASFSVWASTNVGLPLQAWSNLGPATETPPGSGQFQFADPLAANHPQRFYRVRSP